MMPRMLEVLVRGKVEMRRRDRRTWFTAVMVLLASLSLFPNALPTVGQQPATGDTVFVTFSVTDPYGRYVSGLRREYFSVSEKKESLDINYFSEEDKPASVAILFDLSDSMQGRPQGVAKAVNKFIR